MHSLNEFHDRFFLASKDTVESQRDQGEVLRVLQTSPERADQIAHYFYEKTRKQIISKSYTLSDKNIRYVDIVRDVLRYVPLYWTATEVVCDVEMTINLTLLISRLHQ
jgi:linoleate 10R-lipoxygenase